MRRVLTIALVAALVLVLSAGTAFASACAVAPCDAMRATTAPMADHGCAPKLVTKHCETRTPAAMRAVCNMQAGQRTGDSSSVPSTAPDISSAALTGMLAPAIVHGSSAVPAPLAADSRGAPHLSAVIRI